MSLVVTSNISLDDRPETSNVFKPYSYRNQLLDTMRIPPNSEIALQSCKINKNGLLVVDKTNSAFSHFFGVPIGTSTVTSIEDTTTQPFFALAGEKKSFDNGARKQRNIDDFANDIQTGLSLATFHPALVNSVTPSKIVVNPDYGTDNSFKGFEFIATCQTAKTTRLKADIEVVDIKRNQASNFTQNAGVITSTANAGFMVQNREYPISQNAGEVVFNIASANASDKDRSPFCVGLSRINTQKADNGEFYPEYFNPNLANGQDLEYGKSRLFADICVARVGTQLKVLQSTSNSKAQGNGRGQIVVNRVTYHGAHNPNFTTEYNLRTNNSSYDKVIFKLENEELSIFLQNGSNARVLLCDFSTMRSASDGEGGAKPQATKNQLLNCVGAPKWAMYPVCGVGGKGTTGNAITIESVSHYTSYPKFSASSYTNYDWWGYSEANNLTRWCREVELRYWNDKGNTTGGVNSDGLLIPQRVNSSGVMVGYSNVIITAQSEEYGAEITAPCNTQFTFGFVGRPISPFTTTDLVTTIKSVTVPKLVSNVSLFIRLNNFTQNSVNARQGTLSKIIAHLPRFDNSGNETGGLYFEPHERTYLALNNTNELLINSFDIDIVYDNETLCSALSGKTIICFHIRQKK